MGFELRKELERIEVAVVHEIARTKYCCVLSLDLVASVDTPGMAQGLVMRGVGTGRQLAVGDSRAGMRLYGRSGE
jgi:hypothetical protein